MSSKPRVSGDGGKLSFTAATAVLLADGTTTPIGQIKPGDTVEATDPTTGQTSGKNVTALHVNHDTDMTDLDTNDDHGQAQPTIHTTQNHPFWDATRKDWVPAGQLHPGDTLHTATGTTLTVAAVRNFTKPQVMYNLTVADTHTYYVIAGTTPVLVHNCAPGAGGQPAAPPRPSFIADANGTVIPTGASRLQSGLQAAVDAREPGFSTFPTRSPGVGYTLPNGETISIMQPTSQAGLRASFENAGGHLISPFTGRQVISPPGVVGAAARLYSRVRSHIELEP